MVKRVILWACPRSLSSAFYRSISTLSKTQAYFELFCYPYYWGPPSDRVSDKYEPDCVPSELVCEPTYDAVKTLLLGDCPGKELVFSKEMSYCLPEHMRQDLIKSDAFTHTFLIRDPERTFYSCYRLITNNTIPGYAEMETDEMVQSYQEIEKIYNLVAEHSGKAPIMFDAADLMEHPNETMKSYCDAVGIVYKPCMTSWEPASIPFPEMCGDYLKTVANSNGFIQTPSKNQKPVPLKDLPSNVVECIDLCRPIYSKLQSRCIKPVI